MWSAIFINLISIVKNFAPKLIIEWLILSSNIIPNQPAAMRQCCVGEAGGGYSTLLMVASDCLPSHPKKDEGAAVR